MRFLASLALAALTVAAGVASAETMWTEFRGPTGQGHSTATGLPVEWGPEKNVVWRAALPGQAWSSPIHAKGRIFLSNAVPADPNNPAAGISLRVTALEAKTGKTLWDVEIFKAENAQELLKHGKNSFASPTPVYENGRLYAHFGHNGTACLDEGGKVLWSTRENRYNPVHGAGGSPVIAGDLLIFNADGGENPGVIALEKASGKTRWKVTRPQTAANPFSFSTPLLIKVDGRQELITAGSGHVQALNPKDGSELWRVNYGAGYSVVPRPVFAHGMLYVTSGYGSGIAHAIKPGGQGDVTATHVAWKLTKKVPLNPSVVVAGDEFYMLSDNGILTCADAKTGTIHYEERVGSGDCSSSLLFGDGKIYAIDEKGLAGVVKAGKTFELLAKNDLAERTLASMAVIDSDLLIRTEKALYRVSKAGGQ